MGEIVGITVGNAVKLVAVIIMFLIWANAGGYQGSAQYTYTFGLNSYASFKFKVKIQKYNIKSTFVNTLPCITRWKRHGVSK